MFFSYDVAPCDHWWWALSYTEPTIILQISVFVALQRRYNGCRNRRTAWPGGPTLQLGAGWKRDIERVQTSKWHRTPQRCATLRILHFWRPRDSEKELGSAGGESETCERVKAGEEYNRFTLCNLVKRWMSDNCQAKEWSAIMLHFSTWLSESVVKRETFRPPVFLFFFSSKTTETFS